MNYHTYYPWCKRTVAADLGDAKTIARGFRFEADILAAHKAGTENHAWTLNPKEIKAVQRKMAEWAA
jgi:hypothetical protein